MMTLERFVELRLSHAMNSVRRDEQTLQRDMALGAVLYASASANSFDEGTEIYNWYQKEIAPKFNKILYGVE